MLTRPALLISVIQAASLLSGVEARIWLLERDGRAIFARRFGQEQPAVLKEIAAACGGGTCDTLAGEAVSQYNIFSFQSPPVLDSPFVDRGSKMTDVLFGFGIPRSLHCWRPSPSVRSRIWLIRLSVWVFFCCLRAVGRLTRLCRHLSSIRCCYSGQDDRCGRKISPG